MRINSYFGFHVTQYHYHIDPEKYKELDKEKKRRVDNTFLGTGRVIRGDDNQADVLTKDEIVDLTIEDDKVTDLDIKFVEEDELEERSKDTDAVYSVSSDKTVQEDMSSISDVYSVD